ncbi:MAG: DUF1343 domain-containing protein [Acidobacteria bacterium]|nr:DUF1343 domain-containing protein [Acidobacteriota bacterium]
MSRCRVGLDVFLSEELGRFGGARVGLIANPASVDGELAHAAERFAAASAVKLAALFGPQHGAKAEAQDNMIETADEWDGRLGVPVFSLYGERRQPDAASLAGLDVMVCDLPDVGARPYTFVWTMLLAMEACGRAGLPFVVLDRPNPIGGVEVEGPVLREGFESFIGMHALPMRHGLTMGELARLLRAERGIDVELTVVRCEGWRRAMWFDETGLPWVMASPNLPTLETAAVYPGSVLVEGTNLSEGRGTTRPFELLGAPYLDAGEFAGRLNGCDVPGARFRPVWFRPTVDKWAGELCGGVQVHVLDRERFKPCWVGAAVLAAAHELGGERFAWREPPFEYVHDRMPIDILSGSERLRGQVEVGMKAGAMEESWWAEVEEFVERRGEWMMY